MTMAMSAHLTIWESILCSEPAHEVCIRVHRLVGIDVEIMMPSMRSAGLTISQQELNPWRLTAYMPAIQGIINDQVQLQAWIP